MGHLLDVTFDIFVRLSAQLLIEAQKEGWRKVKGEKKKSGQYRALKKNIKLLQPVTAAHEHARNDTIPSKYP